MAAPGEGGDSERFRMVPLLSARRQHERQPMCGDGRVEKRNGESRNRDRRENSLVHIKRKCGEEPKRSAASQQRLSGWWDLNPRPLRPERSALPS